MIISTKEAPEAIGPYSQGVKAGELLFCSGQIAIDPATGEFVGGDVTRQTARAMDNLGAVLKAANAGYANVVRTTIYVTDMKDFAAVNEVYAGYFEGEPPARACVEVRALPKGATVEIDAIALCS